MKVRVKLHRAVTTGLCGIMMGALFTACSVEEMAKDGDLKKVTLAVATQDINIGYQYATLPVATGCYRDEGLDVDLVPGKDSASVAQLLVAGRAQLGLLNPDAGVAVAEKGGPGIKSVYAVSRVSSYKVLVPKDSAVKKFKDLRGKKIGILAVGSGGTTYLKVYYDREGFSKKNVKEVVVGYGAPAMDAMQKGKIDAYLSFSAMLPRLRAEGYEFDVLPDPDFQDDAYGWDLYASDKTIKGDREVIEKVGRCFAKATVFMKADPAKAVKEFWRAYPDRAPKDQKDPAALKNDMAIQQAQATDMLIPKLDYDFDWGSQEKAVWQRTIDYLTVGGVLKKKVTPDQLYDNSFTKAYNDFDRDDVIEKAKK